MGYCHWYYLTTTLVCSKYMSTCMAFALLSYTACSNFVNKHVIRLDLRKIGYENERTEMAQDYIQ
jgi:hypothetical protein